VLALTSFDTRLGELVRVRLQISGTASGARGHYGATGKKFVYRGRFSLASTPNTHRDGVIETIRAHGVDSAPPSPDSLAAVDWHVAVYGSLERSSGLAAFTGPGPVYLLYAEENSSLSLRREGQATGQIDIDESMLRAQATVTYIYRPAGGN
jgi:hypothetical protein